MQHLFRDKGFHCREVFYMHASREAPTQFEALLRLLGVARRAVLRHPRPSMGDDAVCPACGHSPSADGAESSILKTVPKNTIGMTILSLLSRMPLGKDL